MGRSAARGQRTLIVAHDARKIFTLLQTKLEESRLSVNPDWDWAYSWMLARELRFPGRLRESKRLGCTKSRNYYGENSCSP